MNPAQTDLSLTTNQITTDEGPADPIDVQVGGNHYKNMAIQPIEFILANSLPFSEGSVVKYVSRWRNKGGVDDLKKARHLLDLMIAHQESALPSAS